MPHLYLCEQGTTSSSPAIIMVGVLSNPDQRDLLQTELNAVLAHHVPPEFRTDFVYDVHTIMHWTRPRIVYQLRPKRQGWRLEDRVALINAVARIPKSLQLPIVWSKIRPRRAGSLLHRVAGPAVRRIGCFTQCVTQAVLLADASGMWGKITPEIQATGLMKWLLPTTMRLLSNTGISPISLTNSEEPGVDRLASSHIDSQVVTNPDPLDPHGLVASTYAFVLYQALFQTHQAEALVNDVFPGNVTFDRSVWRKSGSSCGHLYF